jgi:hypothetical protein
MLGGRGEQHRQVSSRPNSTAPSCRSAKVGEVVNHGRNDLKDGIT